MLYLHKLKSYSMLILALITDCHFSSKKTFWKIIYKSLHFLSYVGLGLYLSGKKLKEIIINEHTPKEDQNNISPIAHKHQHPFQIGMLIRS